MANRNYRSGSGFEWRYLDKLLKEKKAVRGARFFRSTGPIWKKDYTRMNERGSDYANKHAPVDIWWIDDKGQYNEAQLKYSKLQVGAIDEEEFLDLVSYAMENPQTKVHLVSKKGRERVIHVWSFRNSYVE